MTGLPSGFRVMVTGHRDVGGTHLQAALRGVLQNIQDKRGAVVAISGMALGVDLEFAEAALALAIPLVAAIPLPDQAARWPHLQATRHATVLHAAAAIVHVWEEPEYAERDPVRMLLARNVWMLDHSDLVVAVWDGRRRGGTWHAVHLALKRGRPVLVLDPTTGASRVERPPDRLDPVMELFGVAEGDETE